VAGIRDICLRSGSEAIGRPVDLGDALRMLGGLAEFERSLIKARTDVGIRRAREADDGEPQSAVARLLNVDQSTISRLAHALQ
jgi:hypothetical protein